MAQSQIVETLNTKLVIVGLAVFLIFILFFDLKPRNPIITYTAATAFLMAFWWITEAIPIGATSLLPLVLFPLLGIMNGKDASEAYINYIIFLYIGGFIMALAIQKWGLHERIALKILSWVGGSPLSILSGFMAASGFLSMWMSNTATAMMMLPIAFSVIEALKKNYSEENLENFPAGLLLGVAYACSIGGVSTLVGTPPNLSFVRIYEIMFPQGEAITFANWFFFAFPASILIFLASLWLLHKIYSPKRGLEKLPKSFFKSKYADLGPTSYEEKRVFVLFILLILLWIFRADIELESFKIPGWSSAFHIPEYINDGTIAIFMALLLFIIPSSKKNEALVNWQVAKQIPWHIVLLFGGGFALAGAFVESGLSKFIGTLLVENTQLNQTGFMIMLTALMSVLTEFTSNVATAEMMLPVVGGLSEQLNANPLFLMIPITMAASMAFMFPIATPPNAIVYGTGKLTMKQMATTGFMLNFLAIAIICFFTIFWGPVVFNF